MERMIRPRQVVDALAVAARNARHPARRARLGRIGGAEWAHFVALGVFAYDRGGTSAVGVAGLVRLLPAAVIAPFAATLGDRFRRERFLLVVALAAQRRSSSRRVGAHAGSEIVVLARRPGSAISSTLFRPALQALLPSLARTPDELIASNGATSTIESLGTLIGPLVAGVLVATSGVGTVFAVGAGALLVAAAMLALSRSKAAIDSGSRDGPNLILRAASARSPAFPGRGYSSR